MRIAVLLAWFLMFGSACRGEQAPARFNYTHVRAVITEMQKYFVEPLTEAQLVPPGCEAVTAFVEERSDPVHLTCDAVDTLDELETVFNTVVSEGRIDQSELAIATNVSIARSVRRSHTAFLPFPNAELEKSMLGFQIEDQADSWLVWEVLESTEAYRAGLRPGDTIKSVNGVAIQDWDGVQALDETVSLQIMRPAVGPLEFEARWTEEPERLIEADVVGGDIAYLRVRSFSPMDEKPDEQGLTFGVIASRAIHALHERHPRGWIIDIRGNPGGSQDSCAFVTGLFARSGYPIERPFVSEGRSTVLKQPVWPQPLEDAKPIVILVNDRSASCSEILAESLRQSVGAVVVGTKTPGAVELSIPIAIGEGTLFVTISRVKIGAAGLEIEGIGVVPDHIVELNALELVRGHDAQLAFAVDLLHSGSLDGPR